MQYYKLYFEERLIGDVEYSDADFPSFNGKFTLLLQQSDHLAALILDYIDYSKRYDRYYASMDQMIAYVPAGNELEELDLEEARYMDLIETNSWRLIDVTSEITRILVPLFGIDGTITWRYNFD